MGAVFEKNSLQNSFKNNSGSSKDYSQPLRLTSLASDKETSEEIRMREIEMKGAKNFSMTHSAHQQGVFSPVVLAASVSTSTGQPIRPTTK